MKGARAALTAFAGVTIVEIAKCDGTTEGHAAIVVAARARVSRDDLIAVFARHKAWITSIHPAQATTCALLRQLSRQLEAGAGECPPAVAQHPCTVSTLQVLARLRELAGRSRTESAPKSPALKSASPKSPALKSASPKAAGDAELQIMFQLVDAHIALLEAQGHELPAVTRGSIDQRRTWRGAEIALVSRTLRTDLLPVYRRVLAAIGQRAEGVAKSVADVAVAAQYRELAAFSERAIEAIEVRTIRR